MEIEEVKIKKYNNTIFKKNLNYLLKKRNITKKQLQHDLGMGQSALTKYCDTETVINPSIEVMINLADEFEITIDQLIYTDLETESITQITSEERKEIIICKKLITDTKYNSLNWDKCILTNKLWHDYGEQNVFEFGDILSSSDVSTNPYYVSKFLDEEYEFDAIDSLMADMSSDKSKKVLITRISVDEKIGFMRNFVYELYFIKSSQNDICEWYDHTMLPVLSSHHRMNKFTKVEFDLDFYNNLETLYNSVYYYANYGKQKFEIDNIFDEYLKEKKYEEDIPS